MTLNRRRRHIDVSIKGLREEEEVEEAASENAASAAGEDSDGQVVDKFEISRFFRRWSWPSARHRSRLAGRSSTQVCAAPTESSAPRSVGTGRHYPAHFGYDARVEGRTAFAKNWRRKVLNPPSLF